MNELFWWRLAAAHTECTMHIYRYQRDVESKNMLQNTLKVFQKVVGGKGLFQGRLYHFQAYCAYLKHKHNRAKLLLEDCMVASKNDDMLYDLEWALASRRDWFFEGEDVGDAELQYTAGIKYVLPKIKKMK